MTVTSRSYNMKTDYNKVGEFLIRTFNNPENFQNWPQARWEYMHYHPYFYEVEIQKHLNKIRIWEENNRIVAVVNFELSLGDAYLHVDPDYHELKEEMISIGYLC